MKTFIKSICLFCALFFLSAEGFAATAPSTVKKFHSGVFINRINDFDVKTGTAEVDFWYWVITEGESVSLQNLELSNGKLEPVGDVITQKKDGKFYSSRRFIAHVKCILNMENFPFDVQHVILSFEDGELTSDQMVFVPDVANSGIDSTYHMNEWDVKNIEYRVGTHHYSSSFGYLDIPSGQGSLYSHFNVDITLARRGSFWQKLFKYFWAIVVSVIVGLFSLLIRVCDLDGRFGMAVGALFANVGCSFLLSDKLPQSPGVSLAEWVSYVSLGFIMLFLVESILSLTIYNSGHQKFSRRLDFCVFALSILFYSGIWFFI
ncbi:MAG: hypothetical protein J5858_01410 [Lentisphaeria bacterium]|nr:hypothetical protein [Lentisphaeria bacterium]